MKRQALLNLKNVLRLAEVDLGLSELSAAEKEFFYDILQVSECSETFTSDRLRETVYASSLPHATYHRMLNRLLEKGFIHKAEGRTRNCYVVGSQFQAT